MSEFTNRLLLHHEFWKNPSDFGGVKDVDRESLVADLEEAANTIESLQRENEELRRWYEEAETARLHLEAAAITPEMRETIKSFLDDTAPPKQIDYVATALSARVILHDLLGEQDA